MIYDSSPTAPTHAASLPAYMLWQSNSFTWFHPLCFLISVSERERALSILLYRSKNLCTKGKPSPEREVSQNRYFSSSFVISSPPPSICGPHCENELPPLYGFLKSYHFSLNPQLSSTHAQSGKAASRSSVPREIKILTILSPLCP